MSRHYLLYLFLAIFLWLSPLDAFSQASNVLQNATVNPFPLSRLLPSQTVNSVYQDRDGIIWLATKDGVCRYDGYRLDVLRSNISNVKLLADNDVLNVCENDSYYFFGTRKGVSFMNKRTHQISIVPFKELQTAEARTMQVDVEGYLWIGTMEGLFVLSADLKTCTCATGNGLPRCSVSRVYIDDKGTVWATLWDMGLWRFAKGSERWQKMPRIGKQDNPFCVMAIADGSYWVSTWGNGCYRLKEASHGHYVVSPAQNDYSYRPMSAIFSMAKTYNPELVWMVGTEGLVVAANHGGVLQPVDYSAIARQMDKSFGKIYADSNNGVWLSAYNDGAYLLSTFSKPWQEYLLPDILQRYGYRTNLLALFVDAASNVWFAQGVRGLGVYAADGSLHLYQDEPALKGNDSFTDISYIGTVPSAASQVWVAPKYESAIYQMEYVGGSLRQVGKLDLKPCKGGNVSYFFEDSHHNIWLATSKGIVFKPYDGKPQRTTLSMHDICCISEATDGSVWLASRSGGVTVITYAMQAGKMLIKSRRTIDTANSPLPSNNMEGVCYDARRKKMWMATHEGGLVAYNIQSGKYENHSQQFVGYVNSAVLNLLPDDLGNLWLSTSLGLLRYNPDDQSVSVYSSDDGFGIRMFAKNACSLGNEGKSILFGGIGGFVSIDPARPIYPLETKRQPIVSDLRIGNVSVFTGALGEDYLIDNAGYRLCLAADADDIEIDFSSCNYQNPSKIIFAYKLEGVDNDWRYTTPANAYAFYNHLSKGSHRLLLRVTDANGKWSDDIVTYELYRAPRFYETWWAYLVYIVVVASVIFFAVRHVRRRILEREELRIAKLERKNEEELTQSKLRYFTNVSHDFLTPITIISCIIDDMKMSAQASHAFQSSFDRIHVNLAKLRTLIQQVLDFRKMERGGMHLEVAKGDLVKFVRNLCTNYFEPMLQKKGLVFYFDCQLDSLDAWFDADKLEKMLTNLLSNAYKYTEGGSITVSIKTKGENQEVALVQVKDTGKGISQDKLPHIFERFYTVNEQRSDSNGIGLSLVKELAELHHSSITVESKLGEGSTFTLQLAISRSGYADDEIKNQGKDMEYLELQMPSDSAGVSSLAEVEEKAPVASDSTILIVEDNDELRELMLSIFSRYYHVKEAADGGEGLKMAQDGNPDLIISDVMMPVMDGLEMCRKLKDDINTSHIPIILLTARNTPDDRVACYEAGADGYISKPFELSVLKARIDNFLHQKRLRQQTFQHEVPSADNATDNPAEQATEKLGMSAVDKKLFDKAVEQINLHLSDDSFCIDNLADAMFMSKSTLYRKIKTITGLSPVEFVRNIRLKRAYQMLLTGDKNVTEVAYDCGFSTSRYFSTCFKAEFGISPTELMKKEGMGF